MKTKLLLVGLILLFIPFVNSINLMDGLISYFDFDTYNNGNLIDIYHKNNGSDWGYKYPSVSSRNPIIFNSTGGKINGTWQFNRSNVVDINNTIQEMINTSTSISGYAGTIAFWLKTNYTTTDTEYIFAMHEKKLGSGLFSNNMRIYNDGTTNQLQFIRETPSSIQNIAINLTPFTKTDWHYISLVWNVTKNNMSVYIDGKVNSSNQGLTNFTNSIISGGFGEAGVVNMSIDEFGFWNRSLTDTEISYLYNSNKGLAYPFIGLDNCSIYNISSLNVTLRNKSDDTLISGTIGFMFAYNHSDTVNNYSIEINGTHQTFCISYPPITTNSMIDYYAGGVHYSYYTTNFDLTDTLQTLNLYATSDTTQVLFTVIDSIGSPVSNTYIKIMKYDVGTNTYKTVEVLKTNEDGEALGNIVLYTAWYKFIVEYNNIVYLITDATKLFTNTKTLKINLAGSDWFANYDITLGITTSLTFNNETKRFSFTWSDSSGAMDYGCLKVEKVNATQTLLICDNCTQSTASTILCFINDTSVVGNRYIAQGYFKFDLIFYVSDLLEVFFEGGGGGFTPMWTKGNDARLLGVFLAFILILAFVLLAIWNPVSAVVMMILGFCLTSLLGLINLDITMMVTLILLGIMIIYRVGRAR